MKQPKNQSRQNITYMVSAAAVQRHTRHIQNEINKLHALRQRIDMLIGQCDAGNPFVFTLNGINLDLQKAIAQLTQEVN